MTDELRQLLRDALAALDTGEMITPYLKVCPHCTWPIWTAEAGLLPRAHSADCIVERIRRVLELEAQA